MKNIKIDEIKRWLKSSLKNRISINEKTIITFLMAGFMGMSSLVYADWYYLYIDKESGTAGHFNDPSSTDLINRKSIIIAQTTNGGKAMTANRATKKSVVIGTTYNENGKLVETYADMDNSVALGAGAIAARNAFGLTPESVISNTDGQGVAVGSSLYATAQATALGNNTYAIGRSSIAIGNDDTSAYRNPVTQYDYEHYFKSLYKSIDSQGTTELTPKSGRAFLKKIKPPLFLYYNGFVY